MRDSEHNPRIDETGAVQEYDFETHCGDDITVFADRLLPRSPEASSTED